jgi:signal peptidase II
MKNKLWILIIIALVILDQVTKFMAEELIAYNDSVEWIPNFLSMTHLHNEGAAWGLFQGQMWFFYIMSVIALGIFGYLAADIHFKKAFFYSTAIVLLISGTLGNFIDRIRFGWVVDFIDVYIFGYNYPVFNFADIFLTVGTILFGIDILFLESKRSKS